MPLSKSWADPGPGKTPLQRAMLLGSSLVFLIFIWHRNYNLLGNLYDYSILTSANGYLQAGKLPYRDFTTPLQSLTIYLCWAAEGIFGRRYLSLAYANLLFGLAYYFLVLRLLKPGLPFLPRVLTATALCVCTFFQHGILWYNSLAMMFLSLACLQAVNIFRADKVRNGDVAQLCLWLLLSSMTKANFHALTLALVFLVLRTRFWLRPADGETLLRAGAALILFGVILGPVIEILVNRTTPAEFVQNVFLTPSSRTGGLAYLFSPNFYFGRVQDYYPDDLSAGVYAVGLLVYLLCLRRLGLFGKTVAPAADTRENIFARKCAIVGLPIVFMASALLSATNIEIEILTSSFLLAGLVCVFLLLEGSLTGPQKAAFQSCILFLAAYFLIIGSGSVFMHSRVRFLDTSWTRAIAAKIHREKRMSAIWEDVPFYDAKSISPQFERYLAGVEFTERSKNRLARVAAFMSATHPDADGRDVYWGPGLEMLNRVYGSRYEGRLPLWYHNFVTVQDKDAPGIIAELKHLQFEWIVYAGNTHEIPPAIQDYIDEDYILIENDEIVIYRRIHR